MSNDSREVLLKVEHLEQYFKLGNRTLKAVDDVNFEIYKGEVFGLVGESGCGKTTTGRSIIRLYDITGGSVYYNGTRIAAGIRPYKDAISQAKEKLKAITKDLNEKKKANSITEEEYNSKMEEASKEFEEILATNSELIKSAKFDHKNCNSEFAKKCVAEVQEQYNDQLESTLAKKADLKLELSNLKAEINADPAKKEQLKKINGDYFNAKKELKIKLLSKKMTKIDYFAAKEEAAVKYQNDLQAFDAKYYSVKQEYKECVDFLKMYNNKIRLASKERIMNEIQMIFQDPIASLDPRMTVHDIIAEGLIIRGIKDKEFIDKEVFRVLELVGLVPEHASRYPHEFSGGQRQRIGIARAVILNPNLIIADEPISALDVSIQAQVINLLNELRDKMGLTTLFIAHDLSVVKYFSDRIAVMYFGHIVELATSDELFANPLHPYTKSLLSAIPLPDPHYEKNRKRITYNPLVSHDYTKEGPTLREVKPGHFVSCNTEEFEKYVKELGE